MFDLAKSLGVEEDEGFRFIDNDTLYRVHDNLLEYCWGGNDWLTSTLTVNELLKHKITKIWTPKVHERYYTIDFTMINTEFIISFIFSNDTTDKILLQAGLVFKTEKEAKDMANYLLKKVKEYKNE